MRLDEFRNRAELYPRRALITCWPIGAALILFIAYTGISNAVRSFVEQKFSPTLVDVLVVAPFALTTVVAVLLIIPLSRRMERKYGIPCPHCGKALAHFRHIIIASRNCPYCGKRVIERLMRVGIAIGSNVGDRLANCRRARELLLEIDDVRGPVRASRLYETEPIGCESGAAPFLNGVIEVEYGGEPQTLLAALQAVEVQMGRSSRHPRNASRKIDLDILYAGDLVLATEAVTLPHPRLHTRRFVLAPLADVRPELVLPGQTQTVNKLLAGLNDPASVAVFATHW